MPDLATDLGKASADGLDWTFTLKDGLKYEDGSPVKAEDVAYAIKRSFAQEELPGGPTYQNDFFKGGDTYKGPYKSGDKFAGVSTPDDKTVVIHLRKKFETLPYFVSFSQFSPIPKAKDTKQNYSNHPIATGPYMFKSFTQGTKLELVKNPNWDASTDPVRHQYLDGYTFNFGVDSVKTQQAILASNGPDATTLNWDQIDAQFVDQVTGAKKSQFVQRAVLLHRRHQPGHPQDAARGAQGPRRRVPVRPGAQGRRPDHAVGAAGAHADPAAGARSPRLHAARPQRHRQG